MSNDGSDLISFLRDLANSIEQKTIQRDQLLEVSKFFMSYKFQEQEIADDNGDPEIGGSGDYDQKELIKFLSLGWYIYCTLLKDKQ